MSRPRLTHMSHQEARRDDERRQKAAALSSRETFDCAACGLVGEGCFGFGRIRGVSAGLWACEDVACRAEVEARVYGREKAA